MQTISGDLYKRVSIRPRVAFALTVAERVVSALALMPDAHKAAQVALSDGWRWEEGEDIGALQIYEDADEGLAVQGSLIKEKEASAAMCAVTSAFYYMLWHAFRQDLGKGQVRPGEISGMADVTEDVIDEVCDYATKTPLCDEKWITSLSKTICKEFSNGCSDDLGPVVMRRKLIR